MTTRNLSDARAAYNESDPAASVTAHSSSVKNVYYNENSEGDMTLPAKEQHQKEYGEYVKSVVFGGLDGIITTFAIIAAAVAGNLARRTVLILGFANLVGDAFAMAVGDYLSSKAEVDHAIAERKREQWEMDHDLDTEKKEMQEIYIKKGISESESTEIVDLLLENPETFLNIMMMEELGIMPVDTGVVPWKSACFTFAAFIIFGGFPMLAYIAAADYNELADLDLIFGMAIMLFCIALFALGSYKGKVTGLTWWKSGIYMLINGGITTVASYFIGLGLEKLGGN